MEHQTRDSGLALESEIEEQQVSQLREETIAEEKEKKEELQQIEQSRERRLLVQSGFLFRFGFSVGVLPLLSYG